MNDIPDLEALRAHMGQISEMAVRKVLPRLDDHCRHFIRLSPFLVLATADADGQLDASPRGDPPGFVQVLDDTTLLLPDRLGNNRVDSFANLLANPGVGLLFMVPGIDETLRVNGTATLLTDKDRLDPLTVGTKPPKTGLLVTVREAFFHCGKALKRSHLWNPASQVERSSFPSLARILAEQQGRGDIEQAERNLEIGYRDRLY